MNNPNEAEIPFEVWAHVVEARLRGAYLTMATDFEWMLIFLIKECFDSNREEIKSFYTKKNGKGKDLSELNMVQKIEVCKQGLIKYHNSAYLEYENSFNVIDVIRETRNKFAHHKIDTVFAKQDRTELTLHKLLKNLQVESTTYQVADLWKELDNFQKTMQDILRLFAKIMGKPEPQF